MKIWNTVFIVLIAILAIFTWIYGGKALMIRREWSKSVQKLQKQISESKIKLQNVVDGADPNKSFDPDILREFNEMSEGELANRLDNIVEERGNAWFNCKPSDLNIAGIPVSAQQLSAQQLGDDLPVTPEGELKPVNLITVLIQINSPVDSDNPEVVIPPNKLGGVFYIFDEGNDSNSNGAFLGRFTISKPPEITGKNYTIELKSATEMSDYEIELIKRGMQSTWAIYSTMPRDCFDGVFDRIKKEDLEKLVPQDLRTVLTNPERKNPEKLVDFNAVLTAEYLKRIKLNNSKKLLEKNIADVKNSIQKMNKETNDIKSAIELEQARIKLMKDQTTAVQKVLDGYNKIIKNIQDAIAKTQKQNNWYAAQIANIHLKSLELIEKQAEAATKNIE
ncbi:MAG: programmed cell death protein 10 [Planctomycetaceae bacterium]|jgi:hypothetical protein|nr:programmed cell death protein 10 [Planctomycetaceae bacterium]